VILTVINQKSKNVIPQLSLGPKRGRRHYLTPNLDDNIDLIEDRNLEFSYATSPVSGLRPVGA